MCSLYDVADYALWCFMDDIKILLFLTINHCFEKVKSHENPVTPADLLQASEKTNIKTDHMKEYIREIFRPMKY